jgi:hypothetical protein
VARVVTVRRARVNNNNNDDGESAHAHVFEEESTFSRTRGWANIRAGSWRASGAAGFAEVP